MNCPFNIYGGPTFHNNIFKDFPFKVKAAGVISIPVKFVPLSVWFNNSLSLNGVKNHKGQKRRPLKKETEKFALIIHRTRVSLLYFYHKRKTSINSYHDSLVYGFLRGPINL